MKVKKLSIKNFRRFKNAEINLSEVSTVLAGANNSGKTSLVHLLNNVFIEGRTQTQIGKGDLSLITQKLILNNLITFVRDKEKDDDKENAIIGYIELFFTKEEENKLLDDRFIRVEIEITYEEEEKISLYSDYLMDLDKDNKSFYFVFELAPNSVRLRKELDIEKDRINKLWKEIDDEDKKREFNHIVLDIYDKSLEKKYYFCDKKYSNMQEMEYRKFVSLFNYQYLSANRDLKDGDPGAINSLTDSMVGYLNQPYMEADESIGLEDTDEGEWELELGRLAEEIGELIKNAEIEEKLKNVSVKALEGVKKEFESIGETEIKDLVFILEYTKEALEKSLKRNIAVNFDVSADSTEEYLLPEDSQGLGISNLMYITIEFLKFRKKYSKRLVNLFVLEEPEAHMHPHMQQILMDYLQEELCKDKKNIQGLITTHSNKIVRTAELSTIRVIRYEKPYKNRISDMKKFLDGLSEVDTRKFYETFFSINFSNMIFSDKIIIYEGDTERMYIESLLYKNRNGKRDAVLLGDLRKKYITYAQAGGAYAHKYQELIDELDIKGLILTDMDYKKKTDNLDEYRESCTSNYALLHFYKDEVQEENEKIKVDDIREWQEDRNDEEIERILCKTQTSKDGYARTLEEAILYQLIKKMKLNELDELDVFTQIERDTWAEIKEKSNFYIPLPDRSTSEIKRKVELGAITRSIRDMVREIGDSGKSEFMHSIILANKQEMVLPVYIKEGLEWLNKQ